jgi:hypothetical protein
MPEDLTPAEKATIRSLKRLAKKWPKGLWLFANGVNLYVMRYHPDGSRHDSRGRMDRDLIVHTLPIPSDGGDW